MTDFKFTNFPTIPLYGCSIVVVNNQTTFARAANFEAFGLGTTQYIISTGRIYRIKSQSGKNIPVCEKIAGSGAFERSNQVRAKPTNTHGAPHPLLTYMHPEHVVCGQTNVLDPLSMKGSNTTA